EGYLKLDAPIMIVVSTTADGVFAASIGSDDIAVTLSDYHLSYSFNAVNNPGIILPNTGGPGTLSFTLGGTVLILAALTAGFLVRRRSKKERA
ncbi:MAG: LPXTG cell wall anchor domain-containing protein, partial [Oscillospiraceae bacterium]|nr:LPXTG cell wall anchor domain-containing protein [Oscillospiraceae bacterium]